eukprot:145618-Pleurochrysis_carterae.AAC.1
MSHSASRDRSSRTAPTYAPIVSALNVMPALAFCREPPRRMYSAKSVNVSTLYCASSATSGSTYGTLSVSAVRSANQLSAVDTRRVSVASCTRALLAARSAATRRSAPSDGCPSRHWLSCIGPSAPARPIAPARAPSSAAASRRRACLPTGGAGLSAGGEPPAPHVSSLALVPTCEPGPRAATAAPIPSSPVACGALPSVRSGPSTRPTAARYHALPHLCAQPSSCPPASSSRRSCSPVALRHCTSGVVARLCPRP